MDEQELRILAQKILSGTATHEEKSRVDKYYAEENEKNVVWNSNSPNEEADLEKELLLNLQKHIRLNRPVKSIGQFSIFIRVAAVLLICVAAAFLFTKRVHKINNTLAVAKNIAQNRYLLLPDSSVVLLHPGSEITYNFNGKVRSLNLVGEAYFDIKHDASKPFVIHTGQITTTVLGTAFNIKAYQGQKVTVTVTRGKVSVSDGNKKVRAVLTPYELVEVDAQNNTLAKKQVASHTTIGWVKADMQFDELPFRDLANRLEQRYDVKINFTNRLLENCPVTGRFTGTESLQYVLNIIAQSIAASYTIDGNTVSINGKGCSE